MRRMVLKARKIFNCLSGRESGQILIMVLIMVLLGAVILTPLLSFTISGMKQGQSNEEKKNEFYAADTGIEDAMWKIRNYEDADWLAAAAWMTGEWNESTYTHNPAYLEYTIAQPAGVNGKAVTVRIQPTWILEGLELPTYSADKRTLNDNVTVVGSVISISAGKYEAAILKSDNFTGPLMIDRIGVWLPTGFQYVTGSSNLESYSNCVVTKLPFRNGTAIEWNFSPLINYGALPAEKSGVANSNTTNHLIDSVNHQFTTADVGRSVYNITDDKWGMITGYVSSSDVTVSPTYSAGPPVVLDLFNDGNESYQIGEANRRVVSFSFTSTSSVGVPDGAFCWVRSPGNTTPAVSPYLWWSANKVYQIVSKGVDPSTGKLTTITAYTSKEELKEFGVSMNGDYEATGNCLMTYSDYSHDPDHRDKLYNTTPATLTSLPTGASVQQLRLYWSGWKSYPWNVWPLSEVDRSALVSRNVVDRVSLKVEAGGVVYQTTVIADSWQVLPHGSTSDPRGWNYSCYADVTKRVKDYFTAHGVTFMGNAKYTVGHQAVDSDETTQPLQGVWGSGPNDVFDVGSVGTILHFDGIEWSVMTSGTNRNLFGVWGRAPNDVYAVGDQASSSSPGTVLHYDGSSWTAMNSGIPNNTALYGVWGNSSYTYVVGSSGRIYQCAVGSTTWSNAVGSGTTTTNTLRGVWGDSSYIYVVGASGTILRCQVGTTAWSNAVTSGSTTNTLYGVWGNSQHIYVVGASGTIRRAVVNSTVWGNAVTSGSTTNTLYGIWGDSSYIYVVGQSGTIRSSQVVSGVGSTSWTSMTSGTTNQLSGVWGSAWDNVFAVGGSGSVRHYDGISWTSLTEYSLYGWSDTNHSGETVVATTDYPLGNTMDLSGNLHAAAYAAWSVVVIYSSPESKGHQLYMYDTFRYWDKHQTDDFTIEDFLAPQEVLTDPNAAKMTFFVGEGDENLTGDRVSVNGTYLFGGLPTACNPVDNVWNSKSSVVGTSNIGIDIDTFAVVYPVIKPNDTSAVVTLSTDEDTWTLIYVVLSFRSSISSGGIGSIKVT